jgi:hypothetical protein
MPAIPGTIAQIRAFSAAGAEIAIVNLPELLERLAPG